MKKIALLLVVFGAMLVTASPAVANVDRAQAFTMGKAKAEQSCRQHWGQDCRSILLAWVDGPHSDKFGQVKWNIHVMIETPGPNDNVWEQYLAVDNYGNHLASSFTRVPILE